MCANSIFCVQMRLFVCISAFCVQLVCSCVQNVCSFLRVYSAC